MIVLTELVLRVAVEVRVSAELVVRRVHVHEIFASRIVQAQLKVSSPNFDALQCFGCHAQGDYRGAVRDRTSPTRSSAREMFSRELA